MNYEKAYVPKTRHNKGAWLDGTNWYRYRTANRTPNPMLRLEKMNNVKDYVFFSAKGGP